MSSRSFLSVVCLLVVLLGAGRPADAQTTGLFLDSQPGDFVGRGQRWSYSTADATLSAETSSVYGTRILLVSPGEPSGGWHLAFKASGANPPPPVGVYEAARAAVFTNFAGLSVGGNGRGCGSATGRFVVLEAVYGSDGSVTRFAADFEQHCEDFDAGLFGAVRYNSTVPTLVPFAGAYPVRHLTITPPTNGSIQGDGLSCGSTGGQCGVTLSAAATAAITAVPDPGFVFAGWSTDCSGGPRSSVRINRPKTCSAAFTRMVPASPRTLALFTSAANAMTGGIPIVLSPANSTWTVSASDNGFQLDLEYVGQKEQREISFSVRPPTGEGGFVIGREYRTADGADATHGALRTAIESVGCSAPGTFTVRDWQVGPGGVPTRFSIDYQQDCAGALYGTLQYASTYAYGRLDVPDTALHFTAVRNGSRIVSHSANQPFHVVPSNPSMAWDVKSDQAWLTFTPPVGTAAAARVITGALINPASPAIGHLQVFARGIVNVPDMVTVTLDLVPPDTTVMPFAVFRPASGGWYMPDQGAQQFGLPGDIPMSGDFDGDLVPDIAIYRPWTGQWFVRGQPVRQWGLPGDIPVPADYNDDGITDLAVFRQSGPSAQWFIFGESAPRAWGARGDVPVPGDYDGDGAIDLAVFRPATGAWQILRASTGQTVLGTLGQAGDIPVPADFDGDGKVDRAVFRPSTGFWLIALSTGNPSSRQFGLPGDVPVPLDGNGDGRAELRVWRPSTGMWYAYDLGSSSSQQYGLPGDVPVMARPVLAASRPADADGDRRADVTIFRPSTGEWFTRQSMTAYGSVTIEPWGAAGDVAVPGDYDGDRLANRATYRPSTGEWSVRRFNGTVLQRAWGLPDDVPVPADYDGDGRTDMAVYRPSSGEWFILTSASDYAMASTFSWGLPGDRPVPADFDGDGRADAAVYRPSTGEWYVAWSSGGWVARQWGLPSDIPIARDFDGDGRADLAVYRPSTGEWYVLDAASGAHIFTRQWGLDGDVPVADDYDGDGAADVAVFRPSTHEWLVVPSSGAAPFGLQWGLPGDVPVTRR